MSANFTWNVGPWSLTSHIHLTGHALFGSLAAWQEIRSLINTDSTAAKYKTSRLTSDGL